MKVDKMVPEIYYSGSRNFGFIGRLYEVALNYMKTAADIISTEANSERMSALTLELLCNTLGFTVKHKYIDKDLFYISNVFSHLLRNKGTMYSIRTAIKTILSSQGLNKKFKLEYDPETDTLSIVLPNEIGDVILLEDLFDYILPSGVLVEISYATLVEETESESYFEDEIKFVRAYDRATGNIYSSPEMIIEESPESNIIQPSAEFEKSINYIGTVVSDSKLTPPPPSPSSEPEE